MLIVFSIRSFNLFLLGNFLLRDPFISTAFIGTSLLNSSPRKSGGYKLRIIDVAHGK